MKLNFTNSTMRILNNSELVKIKGGGRWVVVNGEAVYVED